MPLLTEDLSVWDIAHRSANYDPDIYRLRHPLVVKDYFKLLLGAVLNGELFSETLILAKRPANSNADPKYYIRTHLHDINACLAGVRYNRKLLKQALIARYDFQEWCENLAIPLPEFWFPTGWNYSFDMPEGGTRAFWVQHIEPEEHGGFSIQFDTHEAIEVETLLPSNADEQTKPLRANQKAKISAQEFAMEHWKQHPEKTIAQITRDKAFLMLPDISHYGESAHRKWISQVAPFNIKGKKGRPRNNKSDTDNK
jgi:hypothetical protein